MKATIDVKDRKEAEHIRNGLEDPSVRAFVVVMGALAALKTDRARQRVMNFVRDYFDEHEGNGNETDPRVPAKDQGNA
jgi:hypothetical protein